MTTKPPSFEEAECEANATEHSQVGCKKEVENLILDDPELLDMAPSNSMVIRLGGGTLNSDQDSMAGFEDNYWVQPKSNGTTELSVCDEVEIPYLQSGYTREVEGGIEALEIEHRKCTKDCQSHDGDVDETKADNISVSMTANRVLLHRLEISQQE